MHLKSMAASVVPVLKAKFFGQGTPLIISWHLVHRCTRQCVYCYRWQDYPEELTGAEVFSIIDQLAKLGTRAIIFSGGEPLMRDDIGDIIAHSRSKGIVTGLTSNGDLVPQKIKLLKNLNVLKLSFDGSKSVHDALRGTGSYDAVMRAVTAAKEAGIPVKFNTTLTAHNIEDIDFILSKAQELDVKVKFQPVSHVHSLDRDIAKYFPEKEAYIKAIYRLMELKKKNPFIINSTASLKYFCERPAARKLQCYAAKLICCITPNGDLSPCSATADSYKGNNCVSKGFAKAFRSLPQNINCRGCWCSSTLELNCMLRFDLDTFLNFRNLFNA